MADKLLDLNDRIVTDTGQVVAKPDLFIKRIMNEQPVEHLSVLDSDDVRLYARRTGKKLDIWSSDGELIGPDPQTYTWNIPDRYLILDIEEECRRRIATMVLEDGDRLEYENRLQTEMGLVRERGMLDFLRCLVFIKDHFKKKNVVWGVGRGSSCASLVLFLLGINRIDPVRFDIPLSEFYK